MTMVCARFTEAETQLLDNLCLEMKLGRSAVVRQLVAKATIPMLKSDAWALKFFHLSKMKLTQIKYALRLPTDEMWAYISQKCADFTVKRVGPFYMVTLLRDDVQVVAKISAALSNNDMLSVCAEQLEEGIISGLYETD